MKTDLKKILSISGESGLFRFLSQGTNNVIVESLITKKRNAYGAKAQVSSLSDISIYTNEDEVKLKEVFTKMKEHLGENPAPDHKADTKVLVAFFSEVLPDYDKERFYTSHMKKVVLWYNILKENASLEFTEEENEETEDQTNDSQSAE